MQSKCLKTYLCLILLASCFSNVANAGLIVFTDRSAWLSAVNTPDFEEDFNTFSGSTTNLYATLIFADVIYAINGNKSLIFNGNTSALNSSNSIDGTTFIGLNGFDSNSSLDIILPEFVSAFGWDTLNNDLENETALITIAGQTFDAAPNKTCDDDCYVTGFFGVIATESTMFNTIS